MFIGTSAGGVVQVAAPFAQHSLKAGAEAWASSLFWAVCRLRVWHLCGAISMFL